MQGGHPKGLRRDQPLRRFRSVAIACLMIVGLSFAACSNDPYPPTEPSEKVLYSSFVDSPRTLDPAKSYSASSHAITGVVYDKLLTYHFLKRPLELIPSLAASLPEVTALGAGRQKFRFKLREDLLYHNDPCFSLGEEGARTREIVAADIAFQLARVADPEVASPVVEPFSNIQGFSEFGAELSKRREANPEFGALPVHQQYEAVGGISGIRVTSRYEIEFVLGKAYPQIKYWFATEFSSPVPWEAIAYYDGKEGRARFDDHPVGAGPYQLTQYNKQSRMVLTRSENWYGVRHPEWNAPAATYPSEGEESDRLAGLLEDAGKPLPFIDRIEIHREKEGIPRFNKFLQGYYDSSGIVKESFDAVIQEGALSSDMEEKGISLGRSVSPGVFYLGFNMEDPVLGRQGGERSRKLRQAMSLVIDSAEYLRIFANGRGLPAQSPVPPNIYGYDPDYRNPYRKVDLARAKKIMTEAGYPGGVDPKTGEALKLTFSSYNTSTAGLVQYKFYTSAWRQLGIDVEIEATNYNQFQAKLRRGAYQLFEFGWGADYPDPENFLFLFWSEMGNNAHGGPNATNFSDPRFDELFLSMKARENGPLRSAEIKEMLDILEHERAWIEIFHREDYSLYQGWLRNVKPMGLSVPTYQYRNLDPEMRAARRAEWNEPILWPAYLLMLLAILVLVPGVLTYLKERQ